MRVIEQAARAAYEAAWGGEPFTPWDEGSGDYKQRWIAAVQAALKVVQEADAKLLMFAPNGKLFSIDPLPLPEDPQPKINWFECFQTTVLELGLDQSLMAHPNIKEVDIHCQERYPGQPTVMVCFIDAKINNHPLGHVTHNFSICRQEFALRRTPRMIVELVKQRAFACCYELIAKVDQNNNPDGLYPDIGMGFDDVEELPKPDIMIGGES